jgi:hypothetical protein
VLGAVPGPPSDPVNIRPQSSSTSGQRLPAVLSLSHRPRGACPRARPLAQTAAVVTVSPLARMGKEGRSQPGGTPLTCRRRSPALAGKARPGQGRARVAHPVRPRYQEMIVSFSGLNALLASSCSLFRPQLLALRGWERPASSLSARLTAAGPGSLLQLWGPGPTVQVPGRRS